MHQVSETKNDGVKLNLDSESLDKLYGIFRGKMHEVFGKNYKQKILGDSRLESFNAWQVYLRESLSLEVRDAEPGEMQGLVWDRHKKCMVKIMNPSNGTLNQRECVIMPSEFAEKALALGGLPESV